MLTNRSLAGALGLPVPAWLTCVSDPVSSASSCRAFARGIEISLQAGNSHFGRFAARFAGRVTRGFGYAKQWSSVRRRLGVGGVVCTRRVAFNPRRWGRGGLMTVPARGGLPSHVSDSLMGRYKALQMSQTEAGSRSGFEASNYSRWRIAKEGSNVGGLRGLILGQVGTKSSCTRSVWVRRISLTASSAP